MTTNIGVIPAAEATRDLCDEQDTYDRMVEHPRTLFHFRFIQDASQPVFALGGFTSNKTYFVIVPFELYQSSVVVYLRQIAREQFPNATAQQMNAFIEKILDADEHESYYNYYRRASMRMRKSDLWLKKRDLFLRRNEPIQEEKSKVRRHKKRKRSRSNS